MIDQDQDWPDIEMALVAFSGEKYLEPIIVWCTVGGYIHQDIVDGCADVIEMFLDLPHHGIWVWVGTFVDGYYDGFWREPTDEEWILILQQKNPWSNNE